MHFVPSRKVRIVSQHIFGCHYLGAIAWVPLPGCHYLGAIAWVPRAACPPVRPLNHKRTNKRGPMADWRAGDVSPLLPLFPLCFPCFRPNQRSGCQRETAI